MSAVESFEGWAIVELMGHRRLGGLVREVTLFGITMLRIDVPNADPAKGSVTQFYAASALYAVTPTSEDAARLVAKLAQPTPVQQWELPQLPAPASDDEESVF